MRSLSLIFALSGVFLLISCELEGIFKGVRVENISNPIFDFDLQHRKYNRTTYVINGRMTILRTGDERFKIDSFVNFYKGSVLISKVELSIKKSACEEIKTDTYVWPQLSQSTGVATECPVEAKDYFMRDFILDSNVIPENTPDGQYEFEYHLFEDNELLQKIFVSVQVINK